MDLNKAIRALYDERARLDRVIASLEELQKENAAGGFPPGPARRGRKGMGQDERREVSRRMREYWAARRKPLS